MAPALRLYPSLFVLLCMLIFTLSRYVVFAFIRLLGAGRWWWWWYCVVCMTSSSERPRFMNWWWWCVCVCVACVCILGFGQWTHVTGIIDSTKKRTIFDFFPVYTVRLGGIGCACVCVWTHLKWFNSIVIGFWPFANKTNTPKSDNNVHSRCDIHTILWAF